MEEITNTNTNNNTKTKLNKNLNSNINTKIINKSNSRLDIEIFLMGDMKYDLMSFLGECYKDSFFETLSFGNFRRFQLTINNKKNWINFFFIILNNDASHDILNNTFKIYEKRNINILLFNAFDQKSKKFAETLEENLIGDRNKIFDGILNDNNLNKIMKKLSENNDELYTMDIDTETLKENLSYLTDNENSLFYKVGFYPNQTNKKTKNIKKNDGNSQYDKDANIFSFEENEKTNFHSLLKFLLVEYFNKLKIKENEYDNFIKVILDLKKVDSFVEKSKNGIMGIIIKSIDWIILLYILICFYKFLLNN
jgi:hypothetical protein